MHRICFTINGKRHCIDIPVLIEKPFRRPPPHNMPELEVALTVLELVQVVKPTDFTKRLTEVANGYVEQFKQGLPKGVEISHLAEGA